VRIVEELVEIWPNEVCDSSRAVVRATGTPDSRRILSDITVYNYDTTHLQENPQRLG